MEEDTHTEEEGIPKEEVIQDEDSKEVVEPEEDLCGSCGQKKSQLDEYKLGWQRAQADYQNLQKQTEEKRSELVQYSKVQIIEDFIPVYDNFKKAFAVELDNPSSGVESWKKGIEYIMKQFGDVIKNHGIVEVKTVGEMFDPTRHEAVSEEEGEQPSGTIIQEVDSGYLMGEKVIKVAKVIIAK